MRTVREHLPHRPVRIGDNILVGPIGGDGRIVGGAMLVTGAHRGARTRLYS
jgi:hypothetical protein